MKILPVTLAMCLTTLIMTACGGGSGGGNSSNVDVQTTGINITSSNAKPVSAAVLDSVNIVKGPSYVAGIFSSISMTTTGRKDLKNAELKADQPTNSRPHDNPSVGILAATALNETSSCSISGSVAKTGSLANENTLTTGDTLTLSYSSCDNGDTLISGLMAMTFSQVRPGFDFSAPYPLGFDVVQKNFSVTNGGLNATRNGDISVLLAKNDSGNNDQNFSGNSLTVSADKQEVILTNYHYNIQSTSLGDTSVTLQGSLNSTMIDGSVSYTSITPFTGKGNLYSGNTVAGKLHITTSADNSQAWVIALSDGANIQIDIDTDGDDLVDSTLMTTWSELQSL